MSNEPNSNSTLTSDMVEWVVNNSGDLGVKIGNQFFFLYKGRSVQYKNEEEMMDGSIRQMQWRNVGKREFGEACKPDGWWDKDGRCRYPDDYDLQLVRGPGDISPDEFLAWKPLPDPVNL